LRANSSGISSLKKGIGGESTANGGDATEDDGEKALDAIDAGDPNNATLACVELVLAVPRV